MENQISFGNSWQTFISGPKGSNLSLTISGLVAGASYQIALVTGCPFESAGSWNSMNISNTYSEASPALGQQNMRLGLQRDIPSATLLPMKVEKSFCG